MDKQTLIRRLSKYSGNRQEAAFLNIEEISRATGLTRRDVMNLMDGCEYLQSGRSKKYLVDDVAAQIIRRKVTE